MYLNCSLDSGLMAFRSHTGAVLARAFQAMLQRFGLTNKILACNNNNAASNDTQTVELTKLPNSFEKTTVCAASTIPFSSRPRHSSSPSMLPLPTAPPDVRHVRPEVSSLLPHPAHS